MRAVIVGHEELAVEVEDGERQIVPLDLEHGSNVYVGATRAESIAPRLLCVGLKYFGLIRLIAYELTG